MTSTLDPRTDAGPSGLASEALRLVEVDPRRATTVAQSAATAATATADRLSYATAQRALATAYRRLGELDRSERLLRQTVAFALRHGLRVAAAEARMSLSYVLVELGQPRKALREVDTAITDLDGVDLGRARAQRALVLQRIGDVAAALAEYDAAVPALRAHGDDLWETRALNNQAILLAYDGRTDEADDALERAEALATRLGMRPLAAMMRWNRGFVAGRTGDVPTALAWLDEAESFFKESDVPEPGVLVDRCEVLLAAGLAGEAADAAAVAVTELDRLHRHADRAEALVAQAQAAIADARPTAALATAEEACALLRRQRRPGWLAAARYTMLLARWRCGEAPARLLPAARLVARKLDDAGLSVAAVDAHLMAGRLALAAGSLEAARVELGYASRRRGNRADLASRAWHARALLHVADGEPAKALHALRRGMRVLDDYRAAVGATELRVQASTHATDLSALGLRLAIDRGSNRQMLLWLDHCRASALRFRPVRPPSDDALAADLTSLRMTTAALEDAQLAGEPTARLARQVEAVEERIRRRSRTLAAQGATPPAQTPVADIVAAAADRQVLVALVERGDDALALVVRDGRVLRVDLGAVTAAANAAKEGVAFAQRLILTGRSSAAGRAAAERALDAGVAELDALLLSRLAGLLADREVVLLPPAGLAALPWGLLPTLATRAVTVAPSPTTWHRAVTAPATHPDGPVVTVAGPGLPAARREAHEVASAHGDAVTLVGAHATAAAVLAAADGARLLHFATHGRLRADNPLFSCLVLADGPLTVYDLEQLQRAPGVVVLSACESAQAAVRPGDELLGLTTALLAAGSRTLVASVTPVPDEAAADVMAAFHRELAAGLTPAAALAATRVAYADDPALRNVTGAYVCLGAG